MNSLSSLPHHLVQSDPVPGAAEELWGGGVANQHVVLHGPQVFRHHGDQWDRHQGVQLNTGVGGRLKSLRHLFLTVSFSVVGATETPRAVGTELCYSS